jgi:integrase
MGALIAAFYQAAEFKQLSEASQKTYRRELERFRAVHGDKRVVTIQAAHVRKLMDAKADTPAAANRLRQLLRQLMQFAVERGWRKDDPTIGVRKVRYAKDPFTPWSDEDIAAFEARWPIGTRARLALALLIYTGQRRGDVIRMGRQHIRSGRLELRQGKTGTALVLPLHPELQAVLAATEGDHLTFLVTQAGAPFATGNAFYNWFKDCCAQAGLPADRSPHGLRKATARKLAEAGCSTHQIAAITGHKTLSEVERYTKSASQERMAEAAMARIGPASKAGT